MTPILGSPHQKKSHFLKPTLNDPFFQQNLTPNAPYFRSSGSTCTLFSYLSAPPGFGHKKRVLREETKRIRKSEGADLNLLPHAWCSLAPPLLLLPHKPSQLWRELGTHLLLGEQRDLSTHLIEASFLSTDKSRFQSGDLLHHHSWHPEPLDYGTSLIGLSLSRTGLASFGA